MLVPLQTNYKGEMRLVMEAERERIDRERERGGRREGENRQI